MLDNPLKSIWWPPHLDFMLAVVENGIYVYFNGSIPVEGATVVAAHPESKGGGESARWLELKIAGGMVVFDAAASGDAPEQLIRPKRELAGLSFVNLDAWFVVYALGQFGR